MKAKFLEESGGQSLVANTFLFALVALACALMFTYAGGGMSPLWNKAENMLKSGTDRHLTIHVDSEVPLNSNVFGGPIEADTENGFSTMFIGERGDAFVKVKNGDIVQLRAVPPYGMVFAGWQGSCAGIQPDCAVPMTKDKQVTARFVRER